MPYDDSWPLLLLLGYIMLIQGTFSFDVFPPCHEIRRIKMKDELFTFQGDSLVRGRMGRSLKPGERWYHGLNAANKIMVFTIHYARALAIDVSINSPFSWLACYHIPQRRENMCLVVWMTERTSFRQGRKIRSKDLPFSFHSFHRTEIGLFCLLFFCSHTYTFMDSRHSAPGEGFTTLPMILGLLIMKIIKVKQIRSGWTLCFGGNKVTHGYKKLDCPCSASF